MMEQKKVSVARVAKAIGMNVKTVFLVVEQQFLTICEAFGYEKAKDFYVPNFENKKITDFEITHQGLVHLTTQFTTRQMEKILGNIGLEFMEDEHRNLVQFCNTPNLTQVLEYHGNYYLKTIAKKSEMVIKVGLQSVFDFHIKKERLLAETEKEELELYEYLFSIVKKCQKPEYFISTRMSSAEMMETMQSNKSLLLDFGKMKPKISLEDMSTLSALIPTAQYFYYPFNDLSFLKPNGEKLINLNQDCLFFNDIYMNYYLLMSDIDTSKYSKIENTPFLSVQTDYHIMLPDCKKGGLMLDFSDFRYMTVTDLKDYVGFWACKQRTSKNFSLSAPFLSQEVYQEIIKRACYRKENIIFAISNETKKAEIKLNCFSVDYENFVVTPIAVFKGESVELYLNS